eukprot:contig_7071_g1640
MGFVVTAYVDDFGGRPPVATVGRSATKADAVAGWAAAARLLKTLGLRTHPRKRDREGTTALPLLGHVVDTALGVFRPQPQRVQKIETMAAALLRYAAKHRRWVRFGALRAFCGTVISTNLSAPPAHFRTQSMFQLMGPRLRERSEGRGRGRDVCLSNQGLSELRWWARLTSHALLGRAQWPRPDDVVLHTDTSLSGWGAVWNGTVPARGLHAPERRHLHINEHELLTVRQALQSFVGLLRAEKDTILRVLMNSLVGIHVVNNGTSRSEAFMRELRF